MKEEEVTSLILLSWSIKLTSSRHPKPYHMKNRNSDSVRGKGLGEETACETSVSLYGPLGS